MAAPAQTVDRPATLLSVPFAVQGAWKWPQAAAVVHSHGVPHRRIEEWKYSDLKAALGEAGIGAVVAEWLGTLRLDSAELCPSRGPGAAAITGVASVDISLLHKLMERGGVRAEGSEWVTGDGRRTSAVGNALLWALRRNLDEAADRVPGRNLWVGVTKRGTPLLRVYLRRRTDLPDECELLWIEDRFS